MATHPVAVFRGVLFQGHALVATEVRVAWQWPERAHLTGKIWNHFHGQTKKPWGDVQSKW